MARLRLSGEAVARIRKWERSIERLTTRQFRSVLGVELAVTAAKLARKSAASQQAPSGRPWTPRSEPGPRLLKSMTTRVRVARASSEGFRLRVAHSAYKYHHRGTRGPYPIFAKNKKALRFRWRGATVFAKSVIHPGLPARQIIPNDGDLPPLWSRKLEERALKVTARWLKT